MDQNRPESGSLERGFVAGAFAAVSESLVTAGASRDIIKKCVDFFFFFFFFFFGLGYPISCDCDCECVCASPFSPTLISPPIPETAFRYAFHRWAVEAGEATATAAKQSFFQRCVCDGVCARWWRWLNCPRYDAVVQNPLLY